MLGSLRSSGGGLNRVQWTGGRGAYEVWYLTLQDPSSGWAFWFRYTLHAPSQRGGAAKTSLWAFTFPPADLPADEREALELELLDHHPLSRFHDRSGADGFAIELGAGSYDERRATGEVGSGARRVSWDLTFHDAQGGFRHVSPLLYRLRVANSAVATPLLKARVSGRVEVGGREVVLTDAWGEQGHVWGRRHAERWAWFHCHDFPGAPEAVLEGVCAVVRRGSLTLPAATPLLFRERAGVEHTWTGARRMWSVESELELGRLSFLATRDDVRLVGTVSCPPEDMISVEYVDPDGTPAYCNHTESADVRVELLRRQGDGSWRQERVYEAPGVGAFEFGERSRDPRPRRRLDQRDARQL